MQEKNISRKRKKKEKFWLKKVYLNNIFYIVFIWLVLLFCCVK